MRLVLPLAGLAPLLVASPALAAPRLTLVEVAGDAAAPVQLVLLVLIAAVVAAPLLALSRRPAAHRILSALAAGGPLLALAGVAFTLLAAAVGVANSPTTPSLTVLAPAVAEMALLVVLGLLAAFSVGVSRAVTEPRAQP